MTACRIAGAQMVPPPSSQAYANGNDSTVATTTAASAMGQGIVANSHKWTATNGSIDSAAARRNVRPRRRWPKR